MKRILLVSALLAAGCTAMEPYDRPYAMLQTDFLSPSADPHVIPVIVNSVDGRTARLTNKELVLPGAHDVQVDVGPRRGFPATSHVLHMDVQPCTRYYLAARLHSFAGQEWEPIVRSREAIGECAARFASR